MLGVADVVALVVVGVIFWVSWREWLFYRRHVADLRAKLSKTPKDFDAKKVGAEEAGKIGVLRRGAAERRALSQDMLGKSARRAENLLKKRQKDEG